MWKIAGQHVEISAVARRSWSSSGWSSLVGADSLCPSGDVLLL